MSMASISTDFHASNFWNCSKSVNLMFVELENDILWFLILGYWFFQRKSPLLSYEVLCFLHYRCFFFRTLKKTSCVCAVYIVGCLIVYQLCILSLSCSRYSQTICWCGWDDNACLGVRNTCCIGAWPNSFDWRPPWYCVSSVTNKQTESWWKMTYLLDTIQDFFSNFRIKWQLNWVKNSTFP